MQKVIGEILFYHPALVAQTHNKLGMPIGGIAFHNVPENGLAANFNHGLGPERRFFGNAGTATAGKENNFHRVGQK